MSGLSVEPMTHDIGVVTTLLRQMSHRDVLLPPVSPVCPLQLPAVRE